MSAAISVHVPEGMVMAADSRATVTRDINGVKEIFIENDNTQKLFILNNKYGLAYCGDAFIGGLPVGEFFDKLAKEQFIFDDTIKSCADKIYDNATGINFILCGYEDGEYHAYARGDSKLERFIEKHNSCVIGQTNVFDMLFREAPINYTKMPLKEAVDFAECVIDTVIKYERFTDGPQTCGGPVDILVITKNDIFFHKHKLRK
jgi:20S proteasome alpha/beta subunit